MGDDVSTEEMPPELLVSPPLSDRRRVVGWLAARREYRVNELAWAPDEAFSAWSDESKAFRNMGGSHRVRDTGDLTFEYVEGEEAVTWLRPRTAGDAEPTRWTTGDAPGTLREAYERTGSTPSERTRRWIEEHEGPDRGA